MALFPRSESEIAALALAVRDGLTQHTEDFPAPPVSTEELQTRLDAYTAARTAAMNAESATREHHAAKDVALDDLVDAVKSNLRYAEIAVRDAPEKLAVLGWGVRREGKDLEAPGEVRDAGVQKQGPGWALLDWKAPVDGGAVAAYTIQRRRAGETKWTDVGSSVDTLELVQNQDRAVELEYRIVAFNKAGSGNPSTSIAVTL